MSTVLVTAIGSVAGQETIRSLKRAGYRVAGCDINRCECLHEAQEVDRFHQVHRASDGESYLEDIRAIIAADDVEYIFPLTDVEVDLFDAYRQEFSAIGAVACMPDHRVVHIARNKKSYAPELSNVLESLWVIPEMSAEPLLAKKEASPSSRFVIKPKNGRSSEGLEFFDPTTMMHAMSRPDLADCIIQPFIEGNIITVDVLRQASSGTTYCFPRREMIRSKNGTGMSVKTLNIAPIIADCGRLAVHLDLNGMVNIELIESREGLYLMDINPRFSAGIGFTRLGGYDFALNSLRCFTGERLDNYSYMPDRVMIRRFEETIV